MLKQLVNLNCLFAIQLSSITHYDMHRYLFSRQIINFCSNNIFISKDYTSLQEKQTSKQTNKKQTNKTNKQK
jgi:hypothetical protein